MFHAFCQVKRCTTSRPRLQAGVELYGLAGDLLHLETPHQAELWVVSATVKTTNFAIAL